MTGPFHRKVSILFVCGLLVVSAFAGDAPAGTLNLLFSGYVEGTFGPCGCDKNPTGGLARRAGYSATLIEGKSVNLQVDLGNYFHPLGPDSKAVNDLMLKGLSALPVGVMNLTPNDLFLWDQLNESPIAETQFISTNLSPRDPRRRAPQSYAVITVSGQKLGLERDIRIGFLGLSDPRRVKPNSGFAASDPLLAVERAMLELEGKVDFAVVLADFRRKSGPLAPDSILYKLAQAHDKIYAVLSTEQRFLLHEPEQVNNAVILSSVERGRYLGRLQMHFDSNGAVTVVEPEFIELKAGGPEDAELARLQAELEARLR